MGMDDITNVQTARGRASQRERNRRKLGSNESGTHQPVSDAKWEPAVPRTPSYLDGFSPWNTTLQPSTPRAPTQPVQRRILGHTIYPLLVRFLLQHWPIAATDRQQNQPLQPIKSSHSTRHSFLKQENQLRRSTIRYRISQLPGGRIEVKLGSLGRPLSTIVERLIRISRGCEINADWVVISVVVDLIDR